MVSIEDIQLARKRISKYIVTTPLQSAPHLSELTGASIFLKLESEQVTGSFKVRGALNRLITLSKEESEKGVITASTGNHGLGIAYAAKQLDIQAKVVFPIGASTVKRDRMKEAGVDIIQDVGYEEVEPYGRKLAEERGFTYVSPYNDPAIVAGAGTSGLEIIEQLDAIDAVFVPIGGGGLISGIAAYVKHVKPDIKIIAVEADESPCLAEAMKAGKRVVLDQVGIFADGVAVRQIGKEPFRIAQQSFQSSRGIRIQLRPLARVLQQVLVQLVRIGILKLRGVHS